MWSARCWLGSYNIPANLSRLGSALTSKGEAEALQLHALSSIPLVCLPGTQRKAETEVMSEHGGRQSIKMVLC